MAACFPFEELRSTWKALVYDRDCGGGGGEGCIPPCSLICRPATMIPEIQQGRHASTNRLMLPRLKRLWAALQNTPTILLTSSLANLEIPNPTSKMRITSRLLQSCRITLFTRENCGLCTQAKSVLSQVQQSRPFEFREVDIVKPEAKGWKDLYDFDVPVVSLHLSATVEGTGHLNASGRYISAKPVDRVKIQKRPPRQSSLCTASVPRR